MKKWFKKTGFTIVELVIVIAVIAVLAAVLIPTFSGIINKANESKALQEATNAYKEYAVENAAAGKILDDLYVEVDNGYIHYKNGEAVKADNGKYVVTEIPDDAFVVPYTLAVFKLGENGAAEHKETTTSVDKKTYTDGKYTLNLVNGVRVFPDSFDEKGNSCIKVGSSDVGSFSITVPNEVSGIVFCVAGYKGNTAEVKITTNSSVAVYSLRNANETTHTITTLSNDGKYTLITVDTSVDKTITFTTLSDGNRCMINTIKYLKSSQTTGNAPVEPEAPEEDGLSNATITFDSKSNRIAYNPNTEQVWLENDVVVINYKTDNSDKIGDYDDIIRIYKNSSLTIKMKNEYLISNIEINCKDDSDAERIKESLSEIENVTLSITGNILTINFNEPVNIFNMILTKEAVHINKITVKYTEKVTSVSHDCSTRDVAATAATCTTYGYKEGQYCYICYKVFVPQNEIPFTHNYVDGKCTLCNAADPNSGVSDTDQALLATFEFGANGAEKHVDGSDIGGESYTNNGYTLSFTDLNKVYKNAYDAKGNSCLKLGTDKAIGQFTFEVPDNVKVVNIYVAQYKDNKTKIDINGTVYDITSSSDNGEYTKITIDTTTIKTITIQTVSDGKRCMINTIEFKGEFVEIPTHDHTLCPKCGKCTSDDCDGADADKCAGHIDIPGYGIIKYVKVTDELDDWSGKYLIVYEDGNVTFNGSLITLDVASNTIPVTINENEIEYTDLLKESIFDIEKIDGGYTIKSASGFYIGQNENDNDLKTSTTTKYKNSITLNNDNTLDIISGGAYLRYNAESGQNRFRYYKSSSYTGQKAITLYKLVIVKNCTEHDENEILDAVAPTCTETGLTEGKKCSKCGEILVPQTEVPAKGHSFTEGKCTVCGADDPNYQPEHTHTEEVLPAVEATCTKAGLTEGKKCSECGEILVAQTEVPAKGHTEEVLPAKEATCEEKGLTEGKKCSTCGEILVAQTEVTAKGHTEETLSAKEATCTETGLTEGKKCSVCGEILVAQTEVSVKEHSFAEGKCTVCGADDPNYQPETSKVVTVTLTFNNTSKRTTFNNSQQVWEENGIVLTNNKASSTNNVSDYSNPARFYANSKLIVEMAKMTKIVFDCNSGSYATDLKKSISSGITVIVSSDKVIVEFATPVDSFTIDKLSAQVRMDSLSVTYIPILVDEPEHTHTEEVLPGKEATCTEAGLTEGKKCSECGEILVAQTEVVAKGHNYVEGKCIVCRCSEFSPKLLTKVTSVSELSDGVQVIITYFSESSVIAMGNQTDNYRSKVNLTDGEDATELNNGIIIATLIKNGDNWLIKVADNSYLYYTGSKNTVNTGTSTDTNAQWKITFDNEMFKIQNVNTPTRYLQYNISSPRFACYTGTQKNLTLYIVNE